MGSNTIKINAADQEIYSHISSYVECYNKNYINYRLFDDVIFRLYIYAYEKTNRNEEYSCKLYKFEHVTSNGDAWPDILLSTTLANVFGIEQKAYKVNVSDALNSVYACLVLIGKYILCKPKVQKKVIPYFWHMLDKLLYDYETDKKSRVSPWDKSIIAYYLNLNFHNEQKSVHKWLIPRMQFSTKGFLIVEEESREKTEERRAVKRAEMVDAVKKISSDFDRLTSFDGLTKDEKKEKAVKDIDGKGRNSICFQPYLAPLVRASYAAVYQFPYLPRGVYTAYKKYEDIYDTELGINKESYISLNRIIRYKDLLKNTKKNVKIGDDSFLKKYFSVLRSTFDSLSKSEPSGASAHYKCNECSCYCGCKFMDERAYYYLTEKIYGYYLFRYEAQLIKEKGDDFDSLSYEKKRLLKRALKYIFSYCPGVFARLQAANEAIKFIFEDSSELIIPEDYSPNYDEEWKIEAERETLTQDMVEKNSSELEEVLHRFSYENFTQKEDMAITTLLLNIYPKESEIPIEKKILDEMKSQIKKFTDNTGMMAYYEQCYLNRDKLGYEENIDDEDVKTDVSRKRKKGSRSYMRILCWVIKKSVGNKWYDFFEQIEERKIES